MVPAAVGEPTTHISGEPNSNSNPTPAENSPQQTTTPASPEIIVRPDTLDPQRRDRHETPKNKSNSESLEPEASLGIKSAGDDVPGLYQRIPSYNRGKEWKCIFRIPQPDASPTASTSTSTGAKPPTVPCGYIMRGPRERTRHINTHANEEELLIANKVLALENAVAYPHKAEFVFECPVPDCGYLLKSGGEKFRFGGHRVDAGRAMHNALYHPEVGRAARAKVRVKRVVAAVVKEKGKGKGKEATVMPGKDEEEEVEEGEIRE